MAGDAEIHQLSQQIAGLLSQTLSPDRTTRKTAEDELVRLETSSRIYGLATLYLTRRNDLGAEVHIAGAIAFKNYVKRHWHYDPNDEAKDQVDRIDPQQRDMIKQNITQFMIDSPAHIQRQLSEAITIIGKSDFPEKWPSLIVELKTSLSSPLASNFNSLQGILQTAHSIFYHYRHEFKSDRLFTEINLVIEHFAQPLTDRFKDLVMATKNSPNPTQLGQLYKSLLLTTEIYHSLISQDLPEFFEDRLNIWLPLFIELLCVNDRVSEPPMVVEDMKAEICDIASLFVQRYNDAENSKEYTQKFAENIWNLLVTASQDIQYDTLVSSAIRFLVTVAQQMESRSLFQDANVLNVLCLQVIIPNLTFREVDEELFEDDPDEYVKRDIEGSDVDTRRRAACDLVRALSKFLEADLVRIFGGHIEKLLSDYQSNPTSYWKHKDLAIFLYSAMAIKGSTRQQGTVMISDLVNIEGFYNEKVASSLVDTGASLGVQILKADALRYITTFRNYISINTLVASLPAIVKNITSTNVVVRTYASITLEKLLTMRDKNNQNVTAFKPEQFEPFLDELIKTLFDALDMPGSPENEHIMKAIMRLFSFSKSSVIIRFLPSVVPKITTKLTIVAKNPSKPYFNHYLFETLALTIRAACAEDSAKMFRDEFEKVLFSILDLVLAQDVQEFTPYVLQLLNLLLKAQPVNGVSEKFASLFQELLSPRLWEKPAISPPLTELMHTYIEKMGQAIVAQDKLNPLLGIFQKLLLSKATDHDGLALLETMILHLPVTALDARIKDIFMLIFQRLSSMKTMKLVKSVLVCFSLYAYVQGADVLASAVNQIQDKIFSMVLEKLYIADAKKVTGAINRRVCISGMIKILSQLPQIESGSYNHLWPQLLMTVLEIFELPPEVVKDDDDDHFTDIQESLDFQAQYSKLNYATVKRDDPTKDITDMKILLAQSLSKLSIQAPGYVANAISGMDPGVSSLLQKYAQVANVVIN